MKKGLAITFVLALAGALAISGPALAYMVYLKDGSKLDARDKYQVEGEMAIITLLNGTRTSIAFAEIDVARTEEANRTNYGGDALVLEGGTVKDLSQARPPDRRERLADLIARGEAPAVTATEARRDTMPPASETAPATRGPSRPPAASSAPYRNREVAAEIERLLQAEGVSGARIAAGTRPDRPLVEATADSEAAVFRTLEAACRALLGAREKHAGDLGGLELAMTTSNGAAAGQFTLTPQLAADLLDDRIEVSAFFVQHVRF